MAYVEAMAAGVPAIGSRGEPGPEEIAAAGGGIRLVAPGDPEALAAELRAPARRAAPAPRAGPRGARDGRGLLHLAALRRGDRRRLRGGAAVSPKPVLFVTNHAPPFRVGAFRALHEREGAVFALIGGDVRHGGGGRAPGGAAARSPRLPRRASAGWRGWPPPGASAPSSPGSAAASRCRRPGSARAGPRPVRAVGDALGAPAHRRRTRSPTCRCARIYRDADAIATYGPHVSRLRARQGRARPGLRGAPERRRRLLDELR